MHRKPFYTDADLPGPPADQLPDDEPKDRLKYKVWDSRVRIRKEDIIRDDCDSTLESIRQFCSETGYTTQSVLYDPLVRKAWARWAAERPREWVPPWWLIALIWAFAIGSWAALAYLVFWRG